MGKNRLRLSEVDSLHCSGILPRADLGDSSEYSNKKDVKVEG